MIAKVSLQTYAGNFWQLTPENYARLRAAIPALPATLEENRTRYSAEYLVDLAEHGALLEELNVRVELCGFHSNSMLVKMADRIRDLETKGTLEDRTLYERGALLQLHVPNVGLIQYNEFDVLEDSCTDKLQEAIDEGWRVVAVCPPNAQRRPDYIIARYNPDRKPGERRYRG